MTIPIDSAEQRINQRLFETSLDLILVVDRKGTFVRASPSSMRILGYEPAEMIGLSAQRFLFPEDLDSTRREMRLARRRHESRTFDCRYVHKQGHVVPLSWKGVWSEPEEQYFFIGRDMTALLEIERQRHRSQRLEAIGQLTGGIAHDFNNLLSVIIGNLELAQRNLTDPEALHRLSRVEQAAIRGAELTSQLLAFARRQPLKSKVFDMNEVVAGTMDLLQRTLGDSITVQSRLDPKLTRTFADPTLFESALLNLAINSRDAMRGGGKLVVETLNATVDDNALKNGIDIPPGDYCVLSVSDTGVGMDADTLVRVFEPFFTTKAPGEGTGMGLSMVYGFANQSNGGVKIYSEPGLGTTVRIFLPCANADAATTTSNSRIVTPDAGGRERVLVAEDNADVREVVEAQLDDLGYRVSAVETGEAALELLKRDGPFGLLFTDVMMPGRYNGIDLARAALDVQPGLKVLLTSGFALAAIGSADAAGDEFPLLTKPYSRSELASKVRSVLDT